MMKLSDCKLFILFSFLLWKQSTHAIHCQLCAEDNINSTMPNNGRQRKLSENSVINDQSCLDLKNEAFDFTFIDERCTGYYQLLGYSSCECSGIPRGDEDECSLCMGGNEIDPSFEDTLWFTESSGASTTCGEVAEYVKRFDYAEDECGQFQLSGAAKCGCPLVEHGCTMCQDGSEPPNADFVIDLELGLTCEDLARGSKILFPNSAQCMQSQFWGALYCGCSYQLPENRFCSLCSLGDHVTQRDSPFFPGISTHTCGEMELMAAYDETFADASKCRETQVIADIFCGCQQPGSPSLTPAPSPQPSSNTLAPTPAPQSVPSTIAPTPQPSPSTLAPTPTPTPAPQPISSTIAPTPQPSSNTLSPTPQPSSMTPVPTLSRFPSDSPTTTRTPTNSQIPTNTPSVTSKPTNSQMPSKTPSLSLFVNNCTALRLGIIPINVPENAELSELLMKFDIVLSQGYTVDTIRDDLRQALQTKICPIVAGCDDSDENKGILYVNFTKIEKWDEQISCPSTQNCPIVNLIVDVVSAKNESRRRKTSTLQNFPQETPEETIKRIITNNADSLNVPGMLSITANNNSNFQGVVWQDDQQATSSSMPQWSFIVVSAAGGLVVVSAYLYFRQKKASKSHREENQQIIPNDENFIKSDDISTNQTKTKGFTYVAESLESDQTSIKSDDISTNETETKMSDYVAESLETGFLPEICISKGSRTSNHESIEATVSYEPNLMKNKYPGIEVVRRDSFSSSSSRNIVLNDDTVIL